MSLYLCFYVGVYVYVGEYAWKRACKRTVENLSNLSSEKFLPYFMVEAISPIYTFSPFILGRN